MRVWHHACTSWNGKTGEWQLWVKGERVGRGFHNRVSEIEFFEKKIGQFYIFLKSKKNLV
jgi:Pentaxin family